MKKNKFALTNGFLFCLVIFQMRLAQAAFDATKWPSKCIIAANEQVSDFGMAYGMDGAAFYFDTNGKTVVTHQDKIIKRNLENGKESITYKLKQPKNGGNMAGQPNEFETVERTIVITRNSQGQLLSVAKKFDIEAQIKTRTAAQKSGIKPSFPILKTLESEFIYNGNSCSINQTIGLEMENEKSKAEKKVYYDKKFCDQLSPMINQIGAQNASQCANLISQAQMALELRNKDLAKEGKTIKSYPYFGKIPADGKDLSNNFNLGVSIQSCSLAASMGTGFGMTGMGYAGGFGPGINSHGMGYEGLDLTKGSTSKAYDIDAFKKQNNATSGAGNK